MRFLTSLLPSGFLFIKLKLVIPYSLFTKIEQLKLIFWDILCYLHVIILPKEVTECGRCLLQDTFLVERETFTSVASGECHVAGLYSDACPQSEMLRCELLKVNTRQHSFTGLEVLRNNRLISRGQSTKCKPQREKSITLREKQQETHTLLVYHNAHTVRSRTP